MTGVVCPDCGGSDLLQITPSSYRCNTNVLVDPGPPPHLGYGGPRYAVCGREFQVGAARASAAACTHCGRDSIGACEDCGQRLCGLHGTSAGAFLCRSCTERRIALRDERAASAEAERQDRLAALDAAIRRAASREELLALLSVPEDVDESSCRAAWVQVAAGWGVRPAFEIARVRGRRHRIPRDPEPGRDWRELDVSRRKAWVVPTPSKRDGTPGPWIDDTGDLYAYDALRQQLRIQRTEREATVWRVMPAGVRFEHPSGREKGDAGGSSGEPCIPWQATGTPYVNAVARVLAGPDTGHNGGA